MAEVRDKAPAEVSAEATTDVYFEVAKKQSFVENFKESFRWYEKGMPKSEKLLLFKLDAMILTFTCLSSFSLSLDLQNLTNAYVSGMKEDLHLGGNDLNMLTIVNQIPYCVFMIPGTMLMTRVRPSLLMPTCECLWGIFTLLSAFAKNLDTMYAYRFLVGFFGAISYTGSIFIIGSWYKKPEMSRRLGLYAVASPLGSMFSGYLQTAAYNGLNGVNGLEGWRWLFIICSIITFPIAIYGFIAVPDTPATSRSLLLTKDEIVLSRERIGTGAAPLRKRLSFGVVKQGLSGWKWYLFVASWAFLDQSEQRLSTSMSLYLKYYKNEFSVPQINNLPTVTNAISVVTTLIASWYTDKTRNPFLPAFLATSMYCITAYILVAWYVPLGAKFFAWFMGGSILVLQSLLMTWASILTISDLEERAFLTGSMNCLGNAIKTGTNIVVFPAEQAPRFKRGYIWTAITGSLQLVVLVCIKLMTIWDEKKKQRATKFMPDTEVMMDDNIPQEEKSNSSD
ncbi:major facilitator superfamily domain-containing protein [Lipomyces orientalis]|uniref:Major facilitator superfamily domain-containing protein n=1 Tax=Lipomyces orientalis TaxID=1233043 RepID=A0ACC3TE52_9ASCO